MMPKLFGRSCPFNVPHSQFILNKENRMKKDITNDCIDKLHLEMETKNTMVSPFCLQLASISSSPNVQTRIRNKVLQEHISTCSAFLSSNFCKLLQIPGSFSPLLHFSRTCNWAQCCVNRGVQTAPQVSGAQDNYPFPGEHPPLTRQAVIRSLGVQPRGAARCLSARYLQY